MNWTIERIARESGGVPGAVHRVVSEWAHSEAARRLGEAASLAAMKRSDLNDTETELATNVLDLQHVQAQARLYSERAGDEKLVECPYKGLASFDVSDAQFFHGRERVVAELIARLAGSGLLAVAGASGSGKSSIVRAGLIPALHAGVLPGSERWTTCLMRPGAHPSRELDRAVFAAIDEDVRSRLPADGDALEGAVEVLPEGSRLVLVVDQFEETFTLCTDAAERDAFVASLVRAARHPRAAVVLVIRADFFGRCAEYPELAELAGPGNVLVGGMSADEYRRAIEEPAKRSGLRLEPALVEGLVAEVVGEPEGSLSSRRRSWSSGSTATGACFGSRPTSRRAVSTVPSLGWPRRVTPHSRRSSNRSSVPCCCVSRRAKAIRSCAGASRSPSSTRRTTPTSQLSSTRSSATGSSPFRRDSRGRARGAAARVAALARLARRGPGGPTAAPALDRTGSRVGRDGTGHERALPWSPPLAALDWTTDHTLELNEREREFVNASRAENERELTRQRRQNRRLRFILVAVAVLLLLAVAAGAVALVARARSRHDATVALAGRLGAQAVSEPRIDRAVLLAREAVNLNRSSQTEGTLLATLLRSPAAVATFTTPITERPQGVAVSPDGKTLAVVMNEGMMRLYDSRTHRQRLAFPAANAPFAYLAGQHELLAGAPGTVPDYELLDDRTGRVVQKFELGKLWLNTLSVFNEPVLGTPDGRYVFLLWAAQKPDGSGGPAYLQRWTTTQGGKPLVVPMHLDGMIAATATRDGKLVVATDQAVSIWNATTLRRIRTIAVSGVGSAFGGAVSPDGRTVAYGFADGTVHFVDLSTGKQTAGAGAHAGHVQAVAFSPDSRVAVSSGDDGLVIVWDPATGQPIQRLTGHAGRVLGVGFSRDGKTLYTSSLDGAIFKWDLGTAHRFGLPFATTAAPETPQLGPDTPQTPPLAVSPDGARFAVRVGSSRVALYSTSAARRLATFSPGLGDVTGIAWSRSERSASAARRPRPTLERGGRTAARAQAHRARLDQQAAGDRHCDLVLGRRNAGRRRRRQPHIGHRQPPRHGRRVGGSDRKAVVDGAHEAHRSGRPPVRAGRSDDRRRLRGRNRCSPGRARRTGRTDAEARRRRSLHVPDRRVLPRRGAARNRNLCRDRPALEPERRPADRPSHPGRGGAGCQPRLRPLRRDLRDRRRLRRSGQALDDRDPAAVRCHFPGKPGDLGKCGPHTRRLEADRRLRGRHRRHLADGCSELGSHACAVAGRNLTREEWARSVSGHAYTRTCPSLPSG